MPDMYFPRDLMSLFRITLLMSLLLLGGCQSIDFHPYTRGPFETLSQDEIQRVMHKFKLQMARKGLLSLVRTEQYDSHYARFSTSVMPPDAYYLVLAYAPEDGFILTFPLTTLSPADGWSTDIRLQTEDVIFEATSKKVALRVYPAWP